MSVGRARVACFMAGLAYRAGHGVALEAWLGEIFAMFGAAR